MVMIHVLWTLKNVHKTKKVDISSKDPRVERVSEW